ncbi:MAG: translation initiation factor IF-2 [Bacteroidales bacterium]|nr:translation initiation factor IF-2 [Bacteroidales bacterium]
MGEEKKLPRLGAAAKEFNVATGTIVELLKKKGLEIEDNRNAKLTAEMYETLVKHLSGEKKVKEESQKLDMDFSYNKPGANKTEPEKVEQPVEEEPEVVQIKVNTIEKETIKVEVSKPKIIGKIDLEPKKKPAPKVEEPVPEPVVEPEPVKEETAPEPVAEPEPVKEVKPEPEHIEINVENYTPKVVGKIDLEPKKPEPKPEEKLPEPVVETPEPAVETPTSAPEPTTEHAPEHVDLVVEKLKAPNIVGKIDLSAFKETGKRSGNKDAKENKEKTAADANATRKKKRKRIQSAPAAGTNNESHRPAKKVEPKIEISKEDIQRQIKETKQRLEPQGKTKSSKRRREKRQHIHEEMMQAELAELAQQKVLKVTEFITANELATLMNIPVTKIISTCMTVGLFVSINQRLSAETISLLAEEFDYEVEFVSVDDGENKEDSQEDSPENLQPRHPIITVMGHVDHGKTSLLDYIRKSNVIAGEAGGITQHIGAYEVTLADGRKITFLDTPGHEAFTAMRARGAKITDLCIIVIAADDSIMPQTVEAINHAQAAGVPMIFAITKIDKPHANPEKIREGLANMNILVEDWGGKYQCQEIDAKHGTNVNELLEKVLLEAELLELKANPNRPGVGTVIESSLDKGKGYVAKLLVQNGTLKIGDPILAGSCYGKVKALFNERNQPVKSVGPASPVLLLGLDGAPQAGDTFKVCDSEQEARTTATKRARLLREQGLRTQKHITLDEIGRRIAIGDFKELNVIVKGDVDGSVEALSDSLMKLSTEKIQVNVIHKSVGQVTESDVMLASASDAVIVAFQVRPSIGARKLAEKEQIDIRTYSIIYDAIEEIKSAMESMLAPQIREKVICNIEVKEVFRISKVGNVAGCIVLDGKLQRSSKVRLIRDGIVIYTGKLGSLRRFKDDVKEVVSGQDCGLNIENFNDIKVGDIIEGYEEYEEKATL